MTRRVATLLALLVGQGGGSGAIRSEDGAIITNEHVVPVARPAGQQP